MIKPNQETLPQPTTAPATTDGRAVLRYSRNYLRSRSP